MGEFVKSRDFVQPDVTGLVSGYEPEGREFESPRARHSPQVAQKKISHLRGDSRLVLH